MNANGVLYHLLDISIRERVDLPTHKTNPQLTKSSSIHFSSLSFMLTTLLSVNISSRDGATNIDTLSSSSLAPR
jgi:hypothetical protein